MFVYFYVFFWPVTQVVAQKTPLPGWSENAAFIKHISTEKEFVGVWISKDQIFLKCSSLRYNNLSLDEVRVWLNIDPVHILEAKDALCHPDFHETQAGYMTEYINDVAVLVTASPFIPFTYLKQKFIKSKDWPVSLLDEDLELAFDKYEVRGANVKLILYSDTLKKIEPFEGHVLSKFQCKAYICQHIVKSGCILLNNENPYIQKLRCVRLSYYSDDFEFGFLDGFVRIEGVIWGLTVFRQFGYVVFESVEINFSFLYQLAVYESAAHTKLFCTFALFLPILLTNFYT